MEFIKFKKDAKRRLLFSQQMVDFAVRGGFRSGWAFSQQMVHIAASGGFHSGWAFLQPISQLQNEGGGLRNGTHVPRGGFAAAKHPTKFSQLNSLSFA